MFKHLVIKGRTIFLASTVSKTPERSHQWGDIILSPHRFSSDRFGVTYILDVADCLTKVYNDGQVSPAFFSHFVKVFDRAVMFLYSAS